MTDLKISSEVALEDINVTTGSSRTPAVLNTQDSGHVPLIQAIRDCPKTVGYILALCPAILLFGFDTVLVGTLSSLPVFQKRYGDSYVNGYYIPASWLGIWTACSPIGIMAGAIIAGWLHDRWGRRLSMFAGSWVGVVGVGVCFASDFSDKLDTRRGIFLLGKLFEGTCTGMIICTTQAYASEITTNSLRGSTFAIFPAFILLGQLLGAVVLFSQIGVVSDRGFLTAIATQWIFSAAVMIVAAILPESPVWLVRQGKVDQAIRAARRLRSSDVAASDAVTTLVATIDHEKHKNHNTGEATYRQCFQGTDRRRTFIVFFANCIPNFFGTVYLGAGSYILQLLGMRAIEAVELLQVGVAVGLVANLIGIWTMTKFQRRPLALTTLMLCAILYLAMGVAGCFPSTISLWWTAVSLTIIIFVAGLGIWPVSVLAASEISSLHLRGKVQGLGWLVQGLVTGVFSIVLPYIYSPDAGNAGSKTGFLFAGLSLITSLLVWYTVPETKGRTQAEIDAMFEARIPIRQFKHWHPDHITGVEDCANVEEIESTGHA